MSTNHKRALLTALIGSGVALYFIIDVNRYINLETFQSARTDLVAILNRDPTLFVFCFFLTYLVIAASGVPLAAVLSLIGGALMGTALASITIIFAATAGSIVPFLVARFLARDYIQNKFRKQLRRVNEGIKDSGVAYLMSARLTAVVPFFVLNLVSGLTSLSTRQYVIGTFVGIIPGTIVYAFAGSQLGASTDAGTIFTPNLLAAFLALAALPLTVRYIQKRMQKRRISQQRQGSEESDDQV